MGIFSRTLAWDWVASEIKSHAGDWDWSYAESLAAIADIFPNTFRSTGNCRFPLYITAGAAQEWFELWVLINEHRVARRGWSSWDAASDSAPIAPSVAPFRALAQRNHSRSRSGAIVAVIFVRAPLPWWRVVNRGRMTVKERRSL